MTVSSKEKQEREEKFYLDKFIGALNISVAEIERGDDPPDFVVCVEDSRVAIEVTEFHSSAVGADKRPRRAIEEEWQAIGNVIVKRREECSELKRLACILFFRQLLLPPKRKHDQFVDELIAFLYLHRQEFSDQWKSLRNFPDDLPLLNKYLKELKIKKVEFDIEWNWNHSGAFVGLTEPELIRIIEPKIKLSRPPNVDASWLLVVSAEKMSQSMGLPSIAEFQNFSSANKIIESGCYDKVFLYQYMFERVIEWRRGCGWIERRLPEFAGNENG